MHDDMPEFVRETYAVVPRFAANAGDSEIREEPNLKFKFGQWGVRNTQNVLTPGYPGYSHSVWSPNDPAVIRARLIGDETEYTYFWRGRPNNLLGRIGPFTDREVFVQAVALANASNGNGSGDVLSHLHATPPDPTTHAAWQSAFQATFVAIAAFIVIEWIMGLINPARQVE